MSKPAIYVRGVGAISSLGTTWPQTCAALAEGRSGIAPIQHFDVQDFPCTFGAAILPQSDEDPADEDRRAYFAGRAAREAWDMAALSDRERRIGVFIGAESGRGRFETVLALAQAAGGHTFDHEQFFVRAKPYAQRIHALQLSPAAICSRLARAYSARGPVAAISLACASGSAAIVEAVRALRAGECDVALCGGVGADVDPLMLVGFGLLSILSPRGISCPFDVARDGFIVGEGAAMIVLATTRGSESDVELVGVGRSLDAHHLTAPAPDGDGAVRAMQAALADAGETRVDYVQAHGTSTPLNDAIEAGAIRRVLGSAWPQAHVASVKGALGHWVAGAGAIGFLCAWEAVHSGTCLPTAGLAQPDAACELSHVMGHAVRKPTRVAMANAFAFGGANSCLVVRGPM